jgi:hypothetical protein
MASSKADTKDAATGGDCGGRSLARRPNGLWGGGMAATRAG